MGGLERGFGIALGINPLRDEASSSMLSGRRHGEDTALSRRCPLAKFLFLRHA